MLSDEELDRLEKVQVRVGVDWAGWPDLIAQAREANRLRSEEQEVKSAAPSRRDLYRQIRSRDADIAALRKEVARDRLLIQELTTCLENRNVQIKSLKNKEAELMAMLGRQCGNA